MAPRCSDTSWPASRIWAPRWWRCRAGSRWPVRSRSQRKNGIVGVADVLGGPAGDVEVGLLEHVGGVDPALQPAVEAQPDHPPQPLAVAVPTPRGALIPGYPLPQEGDGVVRAWFVIAESIIQVLRRIADEHRFSRIF